MNVLTHDQARNIAWLIHEAVRPDWDVAGIMAALKAARDKADAGTVAVAAIVAAQNAANRSPGVIPLNGPHWPATAPPAARRTAPPPRNRTCSVCYLGQDECRRRWSWDHEFESVEDAKQRAIQEADGVPKYLRNKRTPAAHRGRPIKDVELP